MDGLSQNSAFGVNVTSGLCTFTILDDQTPEVNETFTVQLSLSGSGSSGTVVSPSLAYLTILANDNAFGVVGFNEVRRMSWFILVHFSKYYAVQ